MAPVASIPGEHYLSECTSLPLSQGGGVSSDFNSLMGQKSLIFRLCSFSCCNDVQALSMSEIERESGEGYLKTKI